MNAPKAGTPRAFTLLEVVLATAMGALVIVVALALLRSMEKLDRPLAVRQQELADLHRARTVVQRAMASLVMSDTNPPPPVNARRTTGQTFDDGGQSAFDATAAATATKQQQQQRPPPRLLLEPDQSPELQQLLQQVGVSGASASNIQRLEVVVDSPPIAPNFRAELADLISATYARNKSGAAGTSGSSGIASSSAQGGLATSGSNSSGTSGLGTSGLGTSGLGTSSAGASSTGGSLNAAVGTLAGQPSPAGGNGAIAGAPAALGALTGGSGQNSTRLGALRGAFEIRPMISRKNLPQEREGRPICYELWWVPLPAARDTTKNASAAPTSAPAGSTPPTSSTSGTGAQADDPRTLRPWGEPVLLASNLVKCNWQLFSNGEKRKAHDAVWEKELPAYVEFEVQTSTGLYENWMFEVGWNKGPELGTNDTLAGGPVLDPSAAQAQAGAATGVPTSPQNATGQVPIGRAGTNGFGATTSNQTSSSDGTHQTVNVAPRPPSPR